MIDHQNNLTTPNTFLLKATTPRNLGDEKLPSSEEGTILVPVNHWEFKVFLASHSTGPWLWGSWKHWNQPPHNLVEFDKVPNNVIVKALTTKVSVANNGQNLEATLTNI